MIGVIFILYCRYTQKYGRNLQYCFYSENIQISISVITTNNILNEDSYSIFKWSVKLGNIIILCNNFVML